MNILTPEQMAKRITTNSGRVYIATNVIRIGWASFCAAIAWYWYQPNTSRNRLFETDGTDWAGSRWIVMSFPEGRFYAVKRLAKQLGLRIADGPPVVLGAVEGKVLFQVTSRPSKLTDYRNEGIPISLFPGSVLPNGKDTPWVFSLENDHGSPVYKNRERDEDAMRAADLEINQALNRGVTLTPAQIADYIYGSGPFPNT